MSDQLDLRPAPGFIDPAVAREFPRLRLVWLTMVAGPRPSPRAVKQRLQALSNRYHGGGVVTMRTQPIPHAYRTFFRQVGLDPDSSRTPVEEVAVARLLHGGLRSRGLPEDALQIALVETGVPVWALDAERVDEGGLGIRQSAGRERLGPGEEPLAPGRLVVADSRAVHAPLFGAPAPDHCVRRGTSRIVLFAVGVEGVPDIHLEEALWLCSDVLAQ